MFYQLKCLNGLILTFVKWKSEGFRYKWLALAQLSIWDVIKYERCKNWFKLYKLKQCSYLTSPITWCRVCSSFSNSLRCAPTLLALPLRSSSSITSRTARPIAQDTGFPPNCLVSQWEKKNQHLFWESILFMGHFLKKTFGANTNFQVKAKPNIVFQYCIFIPTILEDKFYVRLWIMAPFTFIKCDIVTTLL